MGLDAKALPSRGPLCLLHQRASYWGWNGWILSMPIYWTSTPWDQKIENRQAFEAFCCGPIILNTFRKFRDLPRVSMAANKDKMCSQG